MGLPKVLLVEDEEAHRLVIKKSLQGHCDLVVARNYHEGVEKISDQNFDLFILDIMLGDGDGFDLCARIRKMECYKRTPVVFLTAKSEVASKVLGFTLGADDYIVKPCDPAELRARVDSKLRWNKEVQEGSKELVLGPFTFMLDMHRLEVNQEGNKSTIEFTPIEFKLLYYLASHKDHVLSRDQILDAVWGQTTNVLDRSVDTYIAAVRRKLGGFKKCVKSVHGVGYKFTLDSLHEKKAS
jgi:DNA-binding response OmpR family regulator